MQTTQKTILPDLASVKKQFPIIALAMLVWLAHQPVQAGVFELGTTAIIRGCGITTNGTGIVGGQLNEMPQIWEIVTNGSVVRYPLPILYNLLLPPLYNGEVLEVSSDGQFAVGYFSTSHMALWARGSNAWYLAYSKWNGGYEEIAYGVCDDGRILMTWSYPSSPRSIYLQSLAGKYFMLTNNGVVPTTNTLLPIAVSSDGSTVIGISSSTKYSYGVRWDNGVLSVLPTATTGGSFVAQYSKPTVLSPDGQTVGGWVTDANGNNSGAIWTNGTLIALTETLGFNGSYGSNEVKWVFNDGRFGTVSYANLGLTNVGPVSDVLSGLLGGQKPRALPNDAVCGVGKVLMTCPTNYVYWFDDPLAPVPKEPLALKIELVGDKVHLSWPTTGGVVLQYARDITGSWTDVSGSFSTNGSWTYIDVSTKTSATGYYCLRQ